MTTKARRRATRATGSEYVRPIEAASFAFKGEQVVLSPNEVLESSHPYVRKHPHLFTPLEPSRQRPGVEQATRAPGEIR